MYTKRIMTFRGKFSKKFLEMDEDALYMSGRAKYVCSVCSSLFTRVHSEAYKRVDQDFICCSTECFSVFKTKYPYSATQKQVCMALYYLGPLRASTLIEILDRSKKGIYNSVKKLKRMGYLVTEVLGKNNYNKLVLTLTGISFCEMFSVLQKDSFKETLYNDIYGRELENKFID